MATTTFTISFVSDLQGFVDVNDVDATIAHVADSQTGSGGSLQINCSVKSASVLNLADQKASSGGTGQTWEDVGVPAGSTITGIELKSFYWKVANNSKLSTFTEIEHYVSTTAISDQFVGETTSLSTSITGWTSATLSNAGFVSLTPVSSNTNFALGVFFGFTTGGGGGSAAVDIRVDEIEYEVTYTPPGSAPTEVKYMFGYKV